MKILITSGPACTPTTSTSPDKGAPDLEYIHSVAKIKTSSFLYLSRFTTPQLELQSCVLSHTPYGGGGGCDGGKVMAATTCRILELVQEQLPWEKGRFSQKTVQTWEKCLEKNDS